jgi:hypothetical protein
MREIPGLSQQAIEASSPCFVGINLAIKSSLGAEPPWEAIELFASLSYRWADCPGELG